MVSSKNMDIYSEHTRIDSHHFDSNALIEYILQSYLYRFTTSIVVQFVSTGIEFRLKFSSCMFNAIDSKTNASHLTV